MRQAAPQHISLPPRLSLLSSEGDPQTPLPLDPVDTDVRAQKRGREEEEPSDATWSEEEVEVLQAVSLLKSELTQTLRHPFRPLSSPYPPGDLPPPRILDELTNQILAYALRGSPGRTGAGWVHGWDVTRKGLYGAALDASRAAHGIEKEKVSRAERATRPGLRRVDSMDFLGTEENVGTAIRLSTSLQNSAKKADPVPDTSTSSLAPIPRKRPQRLAKAARPTSLLQRGRSYTADELQAEQVRSPPARPPRIMRSQSSIIASRPPAHAARDQFLGSPLDESFTLDVRTTSPNWSDSEDEERPKRKAVARKPQIRVSDADKSDGSDGSLQSPFEEKSSFL